MKIIKLNLTGITIAVSLLTGSALNAQVGVNTGNPRAVLHIDGGKDNALSGVPTAAQQTNDVVVTAAGNVGIGTITPTGALEVNSVTGGFVPPRMTSEQRQQIASPLAGTMVYDLTLNQFYFFSGVQWESLVPVAPSAKIFQIVRKDVNQTVAAASTTGDITFNSISGQGSGTSLNGSNITLPAGKTFLITGYLAIATSSSSTQSWARYEVVDAVENNSSVCTVAARGYSEPSTETSNDSAGGPALCLISTGTSPKSIKLRITAKRTDANVVTTSIADPFAETAVVIQEL